MAPTIFICPGIYEGAVAYEPLIKALHGLGLADVHTTSLVSTGASSVPGPAVTMDDDVAAIAKDMASVVDTAGSNDVVLVAHSAGAFLASMAMKGLSAQERKEAGKEGGIQKIVFLAAGLAPEGTVHAPLWFMEFDHEKGIHTCADPISNFFHDLPPNEAKMWAEKLQHQSAGWDSTINYCGWRGVPSVYVIAEDDKVIPLQAQEHIAAMSESKVVRVKASHMLQISKPDEVAKIILDAVQGRL